MFPKLKYFVVSLSPCSISAWIFFKSLLTLCKWFATFTALYDFWSCTFDNSYRGVFDKNMSFWSQKSFFKSISYDKLRRTLKFRWIFTFFLLLFLFLWTEFARKYCNKINIEFSRLVLTWRWLRSWWAGLGSTWTCAG